MIDQYLRECTQCLALSSTFQDLKGTAWFNKCLLMNAKVVKGKLNINIKMQLEISWFYSLYSSGIFPATLEKKKKEKNPNK